MPSAKQCGIVAMNFLVILGVMAAAVISPADRFVAVVVSPWAGPERTIEVVAKAGGALVAPARVGWIVIAHSPHLNFPARLRQAGAWLVLDHKAISACLPGR